MRRLGFLLLCICCMACAALPRDASAPVLNDAPTGSPSPVVTAPPTPTPSPTPTPAPFSILCIPDTQEMARSCPEALDSMAAWVEQNHLASNTVLALHMGDLVDSATSEEQWDNVRGPFQRIQNCIPVLYTAGNHDMIDREGDSPTGFPKRLSYYLKQDFVQASLNGLSCYKGGEAAARAFTCGEDRFLVVTTCHQPDPACRAWVRDRFAEHPDHVGILVSHSALHEDGSLETYGRLLHRDVISVCPNVRFLLCGHYRTVISRTDRYDDDGDGEAERTVATLMLNFQDFSESGYGYMRLLTFDPVTRSVTAVTYSPYHDSHQHDKVAPEEMSFVLPNAF